MNTVTPLSEPYMFGEKCLTYCWIGNLLLPYPLLQSSETALLLQQNI